MVGMTRRGMNRRDIMQGGIMQGEIRVEELIQKAIDMGASDIHIIAGICPKCRVNGSIRDLSIQMLSPQDCLQIAEELAGSCFDEIRETGELDLGLTACGRRIRVNLFHQMGTISAAIRILADHIPVLEKLGLPEAVMHFPEYRQGLILVTGETGSGKSTTLAAILERINETRAQHIITLEDPIEYVYHPDKCIINQRQIGQDTRSYSDALRAVLREDPDIILIGEMRDLETISSALTAAETGHLVFATLHTNSAAETIDRIISVFPAEQQPMVCTQLSATLQAVISQQLIPDAAGTGRVLAAEVMVLNTAIRNLIRTHKTEQIPSFVLSGSKDGSVTMDSALRDLALAGKITPERALSYSHSPEELRKLFRMM
jgi:twitching motility protein PilT